MSITSDNYRRVAEFNDNDRFITVSVYRSGYMGIGRTHKGINTIYIPHERGFLTWASIKERELGEFSTFIPKNTGINRDHWALVPVLQPKGAVGPMSDGNLAYSSDSRIDRVYHIHDRFESQEMYDSLSR